jgi:hypothetical protein
MNIIETNKNMNKKFEGLKEIGKFNMVLIPFGGLSLFSLLFSFTWLPLIIAIILIISRGVYLYGLDNTEE